MSQTADSSNGSKNWGLVLVVPVCAVMFLLIILLNFLISGKPSASKPLAPSWYTPVQDRNKFTANDGTGIMPGNAEQLCARCHGLIFNDWQAGTHGVRRGRWLDPDAFELQKFKCTHCHDPQSPKFVFRTYAPPPVWPEHFVRRSLEAQPTTDTPE
jgi:hypothetical protein